MPFHRGEPGSVNTPNACCTSVRPTWNVSPYRRCLTPPDWTSGTRLQIYRVDCVGRRCILTCEESAPRCGEGSRFAWNILGCVGNQHVETQQRPRIHAPPSYNNKNIPDLPDPDPSLSPSLPVRHSPKSPVPYCIVPPAMRTEHPHSIPSTPRPACGALQGM